MPAIAVAAATPAMASSGSAPTIEIISACKNPGGSCKTVPKFSYQVTAEICNTSALTIYITELDFDDDSGLNLAYAPPPSTPFAVAANSCQTLVLTAVGTNSANQEFTLTVNASWSHTADPDDDPDQANHLPVSDDFEVPGTPPECDCPPETAGAARSSEEEISEQPATEQPATEQPATEQPATEQPATEQPATEQPATEQPATEQPEGSSDN